MCEYIGQLELLFAAVPYRTLPHLFAGRQVIHFVDNTSALAALVKGYAAAIDSGLIVNAYHAYNAGLRADTFFEYVRSKANIADLPSRGALMELLEVLERLGMRAAAVRVPACFPPLSSWRAPARDWLAQASISRGLMPPALPPPVLAESSHRRRRQRRAPGRKTPDQRAAARRSAANG